MKTKLPLILKLLVLLLLTTHVPRAFAFTNTSKISPEEEPNDFQNNDELVLKNFSLVNAETNEELFVIEEGMVLLYNEFEDIKISIKANTFDGVGENIYVVFSGNWYYPIVHRTERYPPYALFGDIKGDYNGKSIEERYYRIVATAYDKATKTVLNTIMVNFGLESLEISDFRVATYYCYENCGLQGKHQSIGDGQIFDRDNSSFVMAPFINDATIIADVRNFLVKSVKMEIEGPITLTKIENEWPFSLFGDKEENFNLRYFPKGEYTITATPYSEQNVNGYNGSPKTVNFTITESDIGNVPIIHGLKFATGSGGVDLANGDELVDGRCYFRSNYSNDQNVVAIANSKTQSVFMKLEGTKGFEYSSIQNDQVYILFRNPDGTSGNQQLANDIYTFTITPFVEKDGKGMAGGTITTTFALGCSQLERDSAKILNSKNLDQEITLPSSGPPPQIPKSALPKMATIVISAAEDTPLPVRSVLMSIDGPISYSRIENVVPFTLFGDVPSRTNGREFPVGKYGITAVPYSEKKGKGFKGRSQTFLFEIVGSDELTYVPDDNFEQALIDLGYDNQLDDYVLTEELVQIKILNLPARGIKDMTGIEAFLTLEELVLGGNLLTKLDLSKNLELRILHSNGALHESIDGRQYQNNITDLDISENNKLVTLDIGANELGSLSLTNKPELVTLFAHRTNITSLDLSMNSQLEYIGVSGNENLEVLHLQNNPLIETLQCNSTGIRELDLSQNPFLIFFNCQVGPELQSINLKSGGNNRLRFVSVNHNQNLTCVQVDDVDFAIAQSGWKEDNTEVYSEDCYNSNGTALKNLVQLFPNPAKTNTTVQINNGNTIFDAAILDMAGRVVKKVAISKNVPLDVSDLKKGLYFVRINTGKEMVTKKLIVE